MKFALFDNNYQKSAPSFLLRAPVDLIEARSLDQAARALAQVEAAQAAGCYLAGYIAYEFAAHFGYFAHDLPKGKPLLRFGVFQKLETLTHDEVDAFLSEQAGNIAPFLTAPAANIDEGEYNQAISAIKSELEAGNSYQVNFTFQNQMQQGGCPYRLYQKLRQAQPVPYGAFLDFDDEKILSRSPELFFEKRGRTLRTRPMKGTAPRRNNSEEDQREAESLQQDEKQQAENLMIVDLLRNDMSRVSVAGSVEVEKLFEVEHYQSVHQMTSTIRATLNGEKRFAEILAALFPCGSITGAPKHITTRIIRDLEKHPRGVYTGAIGLLYPNTGENTGDMVMSVPIRTLAIDDKSHAQLGVGGGIVYDSVDRHEYAEAKLKGKFLFDLDKDFAVIEAFYFDQQGGARHLARHRARMQNSARALGFRFEEAAFDDAVLNAINGLKAPHKIRISLDANGVFSYGAVPILLEDTASDILLMSSQRINSNDIVWQHKTSNRAFYNHEFETARAQGAYDMIFANEKGNLTESCTANLVLELEGALFTPPVSSGVLPGIGRQILLEAGKVAERDLPISALEDAEAIYLISSVRGMLRMRMRDAEALVKARASR